MDGHDFILDDCDLLNDAFGVGDALAAPDASPAALSVPQFLYDGPDSEMFSPSSETRFPTAQDKTPNPWDPRLILDLVVGIDALDDILERYGLDECQYARLQQVPSFRRQLAMTMREVREKGIGFADKCKVQAESYLVHVDDMVNDAAVPASTRLSAIQWVARMGRLEPKEEKSEGNQGVQVNLQIVL
jgi:hypothetical protein